MPYKCGEKPGKGRYVCLYDNEVVRLDDDTDTLPPCPRCKRCEYRKV
ncbi:MAG: hypothetical protein PHP59_06975 [Methanofollis sp.]|nr:hypothetical protein [Methanofollis sp.]MDD4255106.1 hypothetical protein [Methanofollis sp.]